MDKRLAKEIRNGHYEESEGGVLLPRAQVRLHGVFEHDVRRNGVLLGAQRDPNIVVNEGLDYVLNVAYRNQAALANWYIGIFKGNYTPVAGDTAANIASNSTEASDYDEGTRQAWTIVAPASQQLTNTASKATFTINASITAYGAFLISDSAKQGTAGTLNSASRFAASRSLVATDELLITYTLTASDV